MADGVDQLVVLAFFEFEHVGGASVEVEVVGGGEVLDELLDVALALAFAVDRGFADEAVVVVLEAGAADGDVGQRFFGG